MTTTPPTTGEVAAALDTLYRVPGVHEDSRLSTIAAANTPRARLGLALIDMINRPDIDLHTVTGADMADILDKLAGTHGLRITAEPEPAPATTWKEPADWPIPGHAPGLYSAYSTGDGHGPAVITENGRLLIQQNDESGDDSDEWQDHTDLYQSAQWPLTPVTVRITTAPGELVGYEELARFGGEWCSIGRTYPATGMELPVPNEGNRLAVMHLLPEGHQA